MQWLKSRRLHFFLGGIALLLTLFFLLRLIFILGFAELDQAQLSNPAFWRTLYIGGKFDLRLAILVMLPLVVLCYLPFFNLLNNRWVRWLGRTYIALGLIALLLIYIVDFGHYDYLGVRLNATALRFVGDADISTTMLWQSYPVVWITLGWLCATALLLFGFLQLEKRTLDRPRRPISRLQVTLGWTVMFVLTLLGLLGRFGNINLANPVPLRWSDAFFSGDVEIAAIGLNPVIFLYDTFWMESQPYDREKVAEYYPLMTEYLGMDAPDIKTLNFSRHHPTHAQPIRQANGQAPNVVLIMLESLGASRVSAYGNPLNTTPNLDRLAANGWLFKHFFVPVTGTAKTVWASITGIPDVAREETASRNPLISRQHTIINAFKEHRKLYMIGGNAGWANINAVIQQSIDNVILYEEGDWQGPNVDVWGISDLQLFREAHQKLVALPKDKPFFAYIQTAGNHRPFTIPNDHGDFQLDQPPAETLEKWGFRSPEQYNAVRFLDYSVGEFIQLAEQGGYLNNTIFVLFGDHSNRISRLEHMPPIYEQLWLESNHVPYIIYAPGQLPSRVIEDASGLQDVLPTVAGLAGVDYVNTTMGRDIQLSNHGRDRAVPVVLVEGSFPIIGMVTQDFMVKMNYDGSDASLHDMASNSPRDNVADQHPEQFTRLKKLSVGAYETSRYMLWANVREED